MKYGIEKEYFLKHGGEYTLVPADFPKDECEWLLELRSTPSHSIESIVDEMHLMELNVIRKLNKLGYTVLTEPTAILSKALIKKALAMSPKGPPSYNNYLGFDFHNNKAGERIAAVHISFTDEVIVEIPKTEYELYIGDNGKIKIETVKKNPEKRIVNRMFDFMKYMIKLDHAFKEEIKASSRNPGMYELKPDGRVEYRSLPNNIDLNKLAEVINSI